MPRLSAGDGDSRPPFRTTGADPPRGPGARAAGGLSGTAVRVDRGEDAVRLVRVRAGGGRADGPAARVPRRGHPLLPREGAGGRRSAAGSGGGGALPSVAPGRGGADAATAGGPGGHAGDRRGDGTSGRPRRGGGHLAPAGVRGSPRGCDPFAASIGSVDVAPDGAGEDLARPGAGADRCAPRGETRVRVSPARVTPARPFHQEGAPAISGPLQLARDAARERGGGPLPATRAVTDVDSISVDSSVPSEASVRS